jgi:hypothetical protein
MPAALAASLAPAAVSLFPRPSRSNRATPISRSRAFTVIVTAGCDLFRRAAASTNVRLCATATKTRTAHRAYLKRSFRYALTSLRGIS